MQQARCHLFIRHHFNDWYTVSVYGQPHYVTYGPDLELLRQELTEALSRDLASEQLAPGSLTHNSKIRHRSVRVEILAVQNEQLLSMPLQLTVIYYPRWGDSFQVLIPLLGDEFTIKGEKELYRWAEEKIRGRCHLKDINLLLQYQYERNEWLEELVVSYHGRVKRKQKKPRRRERRTGGQPPKPDKPASRRGIGLDLTAEARAGCLRQAQHRDEEVALVLEALAASQDRSVLLVGPSGVGKTAVFHQAVIRIAGRDVSSRLAGAPVWRVTGGQIVAGMRYLGQWQQRCQEVVRQVRAERGVLYVDSLLELLMAAGSSRERGLGVSQLLLPYVLSGEITTVAEVTPEALGTAERINGPFVHALRQIPVPPLPVDRSLEVLEAATQAIGKQHRVTFGDGAISRALDLLLRFSQRSALPGSGLALLEQMARLPRPGSQDRAIGPDGAVRAFSRSSGFPEDLVDPERLLDVDRVERFFKDRVLGQDHAMDLLTNLVMMIKGSLNDPERPMGSFLFMGPTGVGKTESALTLAQYLFSDRGRVVRLDMSEYCHPGSALRMVGHSGGQGDLTRRVREQPFAVVLLDEIEKADASVIDLMLQVLGEGRLTDATGQTVQFCHTIVIMTSNLGSDRRSPPGFGEADALDRERRFLEAAEEFFRPEFINRIDFIVPFWDLDRTSIRGIARLMLDSAIKREGLVRRGLEVTYEDAVLDLLVERGFDPRYGARPMRRAVEQHVTTPLSRRLIRRPRGLRADLVLYVHEGRVAMVSSADVPNSPAPRLPEPALGNDAIWAGYLGGIRGRLDSWEESPLFRDLRETGGSDLPAEHARVARALVRLEGQCGGRPTRLGRDQRHDLRQAAQDLDLLMASLQRALCLTALGGAEEVALMIQPGARGMASLVLADILAEQYGRWGQQHGLELEVTRKRQSSVLRFRGPGAEAMLAGEQGLHRRNGVNEAEAEVQFAGQPPVTEPAVVREYADDPPTTWDPETGHEVPVGVEDLASALDRLVLARLCARVGEG